MDERARWLIETLGLAAHPEGGWYRELFRSGHTVTAGGGRTRAALTTIYFLLADRGHSRWHRLASDEIWHWYEGAPLELITLDDVDAEPRRMRLGPVAADAVPAGIVGAGQWQAARTLGGFTLVGCSVGPGFDFEDFRMLADDAAAADALRARRPDLAVYL